MGKKLYQSVKTKLDLETGEEQVVEHSFVKEVAIENFFQVYLEDNHCLLNLELPEYKVLFCMLEHSCFNPKGDVKGNCVSVNVYYKREWANSCNLALSTVSNAICSLASKQMIFRLGHGVYQINPKYFFKGMVNDRTKVIKSTIEYRIVANSTESSREEALLKERLDNRLE